MPKLEKGPFVLVYLCKHKKNQFLIDMGIIVCRIFLIFPKSYFIPKETGNGASGHPPQISKNDKYINSLGIFFRKKKRSQLKMFEERTLCAQKVFSFICSKNRGIQKKLFHKRSPDKHTQFTIYT